MAPPPEYDKEPKAPDKSATNISTEDSKLLHNLVNDQHTISDHKPTNTVTAVEVENKKHVETLDDGQLKALLDEAINYKNPKDRKGKSKIFNELLEEAEQESDEQACEAAARALSGCRSTRRGGRRGPPLPHSNSLQDLVAALAAEPPRKHHVRHHPPPHAPAPNVSARAIHGGSLPSGVDTSSLSEEPARGAGYLATVRCVNPPPLAERRVSASDANTPAEMELLNRRSKPMFPMTYTARATLEIGSGAVCSGRAVTTTTASNQVRTTTSATTPATTIARQVPASDPQMKLMNALCPRSDTDQGGGEPTLRVVNDSSVKGNTRKSASVVDSKGKTNIPRGPKDSDSDEKTEDCARELSEIKTKPGKRKCYLQKCSQTWVENVENWYKSLPNYSKPLKIMNDEKLKNNKEIDIKVLMNDQHFKNLQKDIINVTPCVMSNEKAIPVKDLDIHEMENKFSVKDVASCSPKYFKKQSRNESHNKHDVSYLYKEMLSIETNADFEYDNTIRKKKIKHNLVVPFLIDTNPKNIRPMSIAQPRTNSNNKLRPDESDKTLKEIDLVANIPVDINSNTVDIECKDAEEHTESGNVVVDAHLYDINSNTVNIKFKDSEEHTNSRSVFVDAHLIDINCNAIDIKFKESEDHTDSTNVAVDARLNYMNTNTVDIKFKETEEHTDLTNAIADAHLNDIDCNTVDIQLKETEEHIDSKNVVVNALSNECPISHYTSVYTSKKREHFQELTDRLNKNSSHASADIELKDVKSGNSRTDQNDSFSKYVALQQKLLVEIESLQKEIEDPKHIEHNVTNNIDSNEPQSNINLEHNVTNNIDSNEPQSNINLLTKEDETYTSSSTENEESSKIEPMSSNCEEILKGVIQPYNVKNETVKSYSVVSAELSNNAYVLLTLPSSNNSEYYFTESTSKPKSGKKKDNLSLAPSHTNKKEDVLNKNILKVLLFENLYKNSNEKSGTPVSAITDDEVDSAISFSCITTPEVVASCNTTSSTSQSAVAVDPKPRSVISSSFNGLPLSRPNYGSTGTSATDDYKKSLDENGNSVQGFSSPLSGSSQHKKPRRKKSSKNETVIDCQQIDGYQGDKDVNELLRFIESNADNGRGAKLPRVKHKDDSDDKGGKKRSSERRKDKETKIKRASSLDELSRTKIEDLTDTGKKERRDHAPAKQERRSWGDDARDALEPAPAELTDFQTVTKKRKPRRRADEPERDPPRRARPPSPRAPPSDRSNDSNDDLDSVHSLPDAPRAAPAPAAPPAPHASYADIARTRHNIPDLIESCNFYAEGEGAPRRDPAAAPGDADGYPALDARAAARRRDKPPPPRRDRKERPAPPADPPHAPDCVAPDVVADRRPPVILLDSAVRPRDMDGVTFGFDVNEQLLSGGARRPRCDLVRDAVAGVAVRAGCAALRYVAPDPPPDTLHLHQIVDYVGAAWEDVVRCGGGKVCYFSE